MRVKKLASGLVIPVEEPKPPTQREIQADYYKRHSHCPACGSGPIEETCMGIIFASLETAVDHNDARCHSCDWHGIVHDLARKFSHKPTFCDTTSTMRYAGLCFCETYPDNLGSCDEFEEGANARCVYCDHAEKCHENITLNVEDDG